MLTSKISRVFSEWSARWNVGCIYPIQCHMWTKALQVGYKRNIMVLIDCLTSNCSADCGCCECNWLEGNLWRAWSWDYRFPLAPQHQPNRHHLPIPTRGWKKDQIFYSEQISGWAFIKTNSSACISRETKSIFAKLWDSNNINILTDHDLISAIKLSTWDHGIFFVTNLRRDCWYHGQLRCFVAWYSNVLMSELSWVGLCCRRSKCRILGFWIRALTQGGLMEAATHLDMTQ